MGLVQFSIKVLDRPTRVLLGRNLTQMHSVRLLFCIQLNGNNDSSLYFFNIEHLIAILMWITFMQIIMLFLSYVFFLQGKYEQEYEKSDEFQHQLKLKVREILTDQEWRRRKMQMRVCYKKTYVL